MCSQFPKPHCFALRLATNSFQQKSANTRVSGLPRWCFVSGHDLSRAAKSAPRFSFFSPCDGAFVQTADSGATAKKLNGKSGSVRRARLQPCRNYLDEETALAAEVRFHGAPWAENVPQRAKVICGF